MDRIKQFIINVYTYVTSSLEVIDETAENKISDEKNNPNNIDNSGNHEPEANQDRETYTTSELIRAIGC